MPKDELSWYQIHWPTPLSANHALGLLHQLASETARGHFVWEARGQQGRVSHLLGTTADHEELATMLRSFVPGLKLTKHDSARPPAPRVARLHIQPLALRLAIDRQTSATRALFAALAQPNRADEWVVLQVVLGRAVAPQVAGPLADPTRSWVDQLVAGPRPASADLVRQVRDKRSEPSFEVAIRVGANAATDARQGALIRGALAALRVLQSPGLRLDLTRENVARFFDGQAPKYRSVRLSSSEVLAVLGWPLGNEQLPGMPSAHPRVLPPSPTTEETGRVFAASSAPGTKVSLGISPADALLHTSLIGGTGSGKSTVLLNLITADMHAGRSVVVVDPKSDLAQDVLARVPAHRRSDVVVLDPTQLSPVGMNPLRARGSSPELAADRILSVIRDLFPTLFGPRTSDVLHASLLTLARIPGSTLTWLPRLLTEASFRAGLMGDLDDVALEEFWASFNAMSPAQQAQFVGPVLSRLRQFLLRPQLRRVLDQTEPRFDLADLFSSRRVLIVPLNTGLLGGDAARLLGSLLVGQLWQLALARSAVAPARRHVVSVYIDEAHEFLRLGGELSDALSRSRSLGVAWHLAHQFRDQFSSEVRAAIDANTLNKIVFALEGKDARDLAGMAPELTKEDFMALGQFEVYARLVHRGQKTGWVSGRTLPPPPVVSDPADITAISQATYGRPDDTTLLPITSPTATPAPEDVLGRRRRSRE